MGEDKILAFIANPQSGKDIRRFLTCATNTSNAEKVQIAVRIMSSAHAMGVKRMNLMPDRDGLAFEARAKLSDLGIAAEIEDMSVEGTVDDTFKYIRRIQEKNAGCLVTLGGDGTARAAASCCGDIPLLPVSTGTNNVYPYHTEGTPIGIAAAGVLSGRLHEDEIIIRDKRIEVYRNGVFVDIALIDAAVTLTPFKGNKYVSADDLAAIIVTRSHPASIGLSAIIGVQRLITPEEPAGAVMLLQHGEKFYVPISSGCLTPLACKKPRLLALEEKWSFDADFHGTVALDGEREIEFHPGDRLDFFIRHNGPKRVLYHKVCEEMMYINAFAKKSYRED